MSQPKNPMENITLNIINSKRDIYGNCYYAFTAFNHETQKTVNGISNGGDSNIRYSEFELRGRWPNTGEKRWCINYFELPIRKFNQLVKGWPYAGCMPKQIFEFIKNGTK